MQDFNISVCVCVKEKLLKRIKWHLPPRSYMTGNRERSNAAITSLPHMLQIAFNPYMNFIISSSDLEFEIAQAVSSLQMPTMIYCYVKDMDSFSAILIKRIAYSLTHPWDLCADGPIHFCGRSSSANGHMDLLFLLHEQKSLYMIVLGKSLKKPRIGPWHPGLS